jgi:hypothetical protein
VDVVPALIANCEPAVLRKPGQCALHNPPMSPQLLAALYALPSYTALYPASSQGCLALLIIVGFVGVQLLGTPPRSLPLGRLIGSTASMSSSKAIESWTFAAVSITASGTPLRSEIRWRFVPFFPLSVGFAPVFAPPFWPGWKPNRVRHAPSRSGRPLRGAPEELGAAFPTRPPHAIPSSVASKSSPSRSPSPGAASPRGCRSLARRRFPLELPDRRCAVFRLGVLAAREAEAVRWFPTVHL